MNARRRFLLLAGFISLATLAVVTLAVGMLYRVTMNARREGLLELATDRASLVETIFTRSRDRMETLREIRQAFQLAPGLGKTGEVTLAKREGGRMVWLISRRFGLSAGPFSVPVGDALAEPMQRALRGERGTMIGRDYRGQPVLAGYALAPGPGWAVVAKVDLAEARAPFWHAGLVASGLTLFLVVLGTAVFIGVTSPVVRRLETSEKQYRSLFEESPVGIYRTTPDGRILFANPALLNMLGYDSLAELGLRNLEQAGFQSGPPRQDFKEALGRDGVIRGYRAQWARKDGETLYVQESAQAVWGADGEVLYYDGTAEDVTERHLAVQEIGQLNRRLQDLIEAIQALAAARDIEAISDVVRTHARRLTGADGVTVVLRDGDQCHYVAEDAIAPLWKGRRFPMSECISGWVMLNRRQAIITDIYRDQRIPTDVYRSTFVKSLAMVPIRTADPLGAIGNYWAQEHTPTTDEVQLLQTLADAAARALENVTLLEELEERVRRRTSELAATNRELEAFAYSVSHDLRAPLRAIDGFSQALLEDCSERLDELGRGYLDRVRANAQRMGRLIDDLLKLSRVTRDEMRPEKVSISTLAASVVRDLRRSEPERHIDLTIPDDLTATADRRLLEVLLSNLLGNAWKFTARRPQAHVEVGAADYDGERAFFVRDDGAGFDMAHSDKLFGAFQRLHSSAEFEGTGIGLATAQRIVHRHGGRVWAKGAVGEGATFYFTLPDRPQDKLETAEKDE